MAFSRPVYWSGQPFPSPGDLPNSGIESRSPTLQVDSSPAEPQGKPKNTGVGSLSLLQGIFPIQELNQGLLHYRWILYQLNYQGSPKDPNCCPKWFYLFAFLSALQDYPCPYTLIMYIGKFCQSFVLILGEVLLQTNLILMRPHLFFFYGFYILHLLQEFCC